jgi:hypothetical protein
MNAPCNSNGRAGGPFRFGDRDHMPSMVSDTPDPACEAPTDLD